MLNKRPSTVSMWLSGRQKPSIDDQPTVHKLAEFLHITPTETAKLIEAHPQERIEDTAADVWTITTLKDALRVFGHEAPDLLGRAIPLNTGVTLPGLQEKLRGYGYAIEEAVLRKFLTTKAQDVLPPDERYIWEDAQTILRCRIPRRAGQALRQPLSRDSIRQACQALNAAFAEAGEELSESHAIQLVHAALLSDMGNEPSETLDECSTALLQQLIELKLLNYTTAQTLKRRWPCSPEYVINKVFGIPPDVAGLDFLLDGGLLPPSAAGLSILLQGRPGTGKTMLALQFAASIALQGGVAVYLSAEEDLSSLIEHLSFAGYQLPTNQDAAIVISFVMILTLSGSGPTSQGPSTGIQHGCMSMVC
jgi:hypothetical protein